MIMIKTGKKSLSEMKEKLHKMRLEAQELEEMIDDCERHQDRDYDDDYDYRRHDRDDDYDRRDRDERSRGRYRY